MIIGAKTPSLIRCYWTVVILFVEIPSTPYFSQRAS